MKSLLFISFGALLFSGCTLSADTSDIDEFGDYKEVHFERIESQHNLEPEDRDPRTILLRLEGEDEGMTLLLDHDQLADSEGVAKENLRSITIEDNIFSIEGEESEFTFTPLSKSVYELDNGTRYQPFAVEDVERLDENPFYAVE